MNSGGHGVLCREYYIMGPTRIHNPHVGSMSFGLTRNVDRDF